MDGEGDMVVEREVIGAETGQPGKPHVSVCVAGYKEPLKCKESWQKFKAITRGIVEQSVQ
jgi:hypothetical protein